MREHICHNIIISYINTTNAFQNKTQLKKIYKYILYYCIRAHMWLWLLYVYVHIYIII